MCWRTFRLLRILAIVNNATINMHAQVSLWYHFEFLWIYTKKWDTESCGNSIFNYLGNVHTVFHSSWTSFGSYYQYTNILFFSHPEQKLLSLFFFLSETILTDAKWYLTVVLNCIPLMISDAQHFFHVLVGNLYALYDWFLIGLKVMRLILTDWLAEGLIYLLGYLFMYLCTLLLILLDVLLHSYICDNDVFY